MLTVLSFTEGYTGRFNSNVDESQLELYKAFFLRFFEIPSKVINSQDNQKHCENELANVITAKQEKKEMAHYFQKCLFPIVFAGTRISFLSRIEAISLVSSNLYLKLQTPTDLEKLQSRIKSKVNSDTGKELFELAATHPEAVNAFRKLIYAELNTYIIANLLKKKQPCPLELD